ncbi:hypothetical protein HNY73_010761 [Argiope bruennichi]|uniref:MULE transposase domain-containing protein n=1 Tax=Argiope bruennichi TaxID=94029 RepID=A0A8T0F236_ARGBR|nr:hypothetical protein HNY73_010761 [Argiope bruennichi]
MEVLDLIKTSKNKDSAIFDGYRYRLHRTNKQNISSWLCMKEKSPNCRGTLISKDGKVLHVSSHNCKPDVAATEIAKKLCTVKKRVREEGSSISKIYMQEMSPLFHRGHDYAGSIPTLSAIRRQLNRIRQKDQGAILEPKISQDIILDDDIIMDDGSGFLLDDVNSDNRILIFASSKGRNTLKNNKHFLMDGTFKSCSMQFCQIYTIHAVLTKSNQEDRTIVPIVFSLLPRKNSETYSKLFTVLKDAGWNPYSITMDFEAAVLKELERLFPSVKISGCNFYFNQCLWRQVQSLGLVQEYKENDEIRLHVRMCAALAHLPEDDIEDGWLSIQETSPLQSKLQQFYDYFVKEWLDNSVISTSMWNML